MFQDIMNNPILRTDSYKFSHWKMYPAGMDGMHAYLESRGSDLPFFKNRVVVFGIRHTIKKYFSDVRITAAHVEQAKEFVDAHIGPGVFNYDGWMYIVNVHKGILPLEIRGLPEGTIAPCFTAILTVRETDPNCAWLVSYYEPILLHLWYSMTVCTLSFEIKQIIQAAYDKTSDVDCNLALHDFGYRGVSSHETAEIGGLAHIVNFLGSDTVAGIGAAYTYYNTQFMPAYSVMASEHTVMCALSDCDERDDYAAAERMIQLLEDPEADDGRILSVVSDTFDVYRFTKEFICTRLANRIKAACEKSGSCLVIRPDSGDPCEVPIEIIETLMETFGYTMNSKGYKVLPDFIRVIQGDGINIESIDEILDIMEQHWLAADNIVFGSGGALLQHCDRDWLKFAMKASAVRINSVWKDVYKDPITDRRKASKRGRLTTYRDQEGKLLTDRVELAEVNHNLTDAMMTYYNNGMLSGHSLEQIRKRLVEETKKLAA